MSKPYKVKDKFFIKAKKEGYRARSAYKMKEIQDHFHLISKGDTVVDLGAAPGSFMQVLIRLVGKEGKVLGIDLKAIEPFDHPAAYFIQGNIQHVKALSPVLKDFGPVDCVTSDLAPYTSGVRDVDQARSIELTHDALNLTLACLRPGGHFVAKVFQGEDLAPLMKEVKQNFKKVKLFKPKACRDRSFETYIVAMDRKTT